MKKKEDAQELYYRLLEEKRKATDWSNLQSVKEYNRYADDLRHALLYED